MDEHQQHKNMQMQQQDNILRNIDKQNKAAEREVENEVEEMEEQKQSDSGHSK